MTITLRTTPATTAWGNVLLAHSRLTKRLDAELRAETDLTFRRELVDDLDLCLLPVAVFDIRI